jgi:AcrR family transcriptional regulator
VAPAPGTQISDLTGTRTRLSSEREAELYRAVLDLLVASGYEALTMDAVAHAAKTSKATIYRQWGGKPGLVASALRHLKSDQVAEEDSGSLRGDLLAVARIVGCVAVENGQLFAAISHAVQADPALAAAVRECMAEPSSHLFDRVIERAVGRGEVDPRNPAIAHVSRLFLQAIVARPILEGRYVDGDYLAGLVDSVVLPALAGSAPGRSKKGS